MPVFCASCGGELFGAVNRCWHCRRSFAKPPSQDGRPAVRRAPVIVVGLSPATDRVVVTDDSATSLQPTGKAAPSDDSSSSESAGRIPVGSPFSAGWTPTRTERGRPAPAPLTYADPDADEVGRWGAIAGLLCGSGGLVASAFCPWPIFLAWLGISAATLGLKNYRALAILALFLCCFVLNVQGWMMARALYESVFGIDPWDAVFAPGG